MTIQSTLIRLTCLAALLLLPAFSGKKAATSEIPLRREFPLSSTIKPCDNFYGYVCTGAIDGFVLREDRSKHVFSFSDSNERLLDAKKNWLASLSTKKDLSPRAKELRNIYQACMDEKASAKEEKEGVKRVLDQVSALKDRKAFIAFLSQKVDGTDYSFIEWGTIGNLDDPNWNDVYFLADIQSLPERSYYEKPEVTGDLQSLAQKVFEIAGLDNPAERAKSVVEFEKTFSKTYPTPAEIQDLVNQRTGIDREKLKKEYPDFELARFLDRLPKRTHLRHLTPKNFEWMNTALKETSLETLKNVYLFHALPEYMDDAYPEYFQKQFEFRRKHLGGPNVRPVRQERCTTYVMGKFAKEIDAELLPVLFPSFDEAKFVAMIEKVRASIIKGIQSNDWLSPKSKKAAVKKMQAAKLHLVKPRNEEEWDFNPPATYAPDKPYANDKLLAKNLIDKELKELGEKRNRDRWAMGPLTVNAYYSPSDNKFVLPIGILQYPFYDPALPDSTNLGAVGMVVGHELGHGVDDHGAKYDHEGKMIQWMSDRDIKEFEKRGASLITQFEKIGHNGKLTLGENIGDLVGLTFAYQAAFPNGKGTPEDKKKFFTQYGRAWCGVIRPKLREMLLKTDPHAAMEARVNEQVKHQTAFQEVFGCKEGDAMFLSPKDRVRIW